MADQAPKGDILIVDDSPQSVAELAALLADSCRCRSARDGEEAFARLEDRALPLPDLILLDADLPVMDGFEVCVRLRQDPRLRGLPVVLLTARADAEFKHRAFSCGAADLLPRPFHADEVRARVETRLRLRRAERELALHGRELDRLVRELAARDLDALMATLFALVRLGNSRDAATGDRVDRIRESCRLIAAELRRSPLHADRIDDGYVERIRSACVLHDIGKVAVPDRILLKPGPLTSEEREEMRRHTLLGARALQEAIDRHPGNAFLEMGAEIALCHHERWDGSGYPRGLSGDRIPLSAQIMAVVDDYDALVSVRPYKLAFARGDALGVILSGSGTHYSPAVVAAFAACEPRVWALHSGPK